MNIGFLRDKWFWLWYSINIFSGPLCNASKTRIEEMHSPVWSLDSPIWSKDLETLLIYTLWYEFINDFDAQSGKTFITKKLVPWNHSYLLKYALGGLWPAKLIRYLLIKHLPFPVCSSYQIRNVCNSITNGTFYEYYSLLLICRLSKGIIENYCFVEVWSRSDYSNNLDLFGQKALKDSIEKWT